MPDQSPVWLITGGPPGRGGAGAARVLAGGWRGGAPARDPAAGAELAAGQPDRALALRLDVNDPAQVAAAVRESEARFGRIDVLVNNAGYGYLAAVEEGEDAAVRALFETNFFGLVAMTKAVLPGMRQRRRGHVINVSSIGGLVSFPATGYYHATKYAVEGLSGSLAQELAPLGIKVTAVEPGPFRTDWAGRSIKQSATRIADYDQTAGARRAQTEQRSGKQPGDPVRAADAMIAVTESPDPPLHLVLGGPALGLARGKLDQLRGDLDAWQDTTLGADYPDQRAAG